MWRDQESDTLSGAEWCYTVMCSIPEQRAHEPDTNCFIKSLMELISVSYSLICDVYGLKVKNGV